MSDDDREDHDDELAWLVARERGQPGPPVSAATAARHERLEALLKDLPAMPAGVPPRAGWQRDVLAAIDAADAEAEVASDPAAVGAIDPAPPKRTSSPRRRWAAPGAILAAAAIVVIVLAVWRDRGLGPGAAAPGSDTWIVRGGGDAVARDRGPGMGGARPTLAFEVQPDERAHRSTEASAGDTLIVQGVVEGPGELRVYDAAGNEQARCTGTAPDCTVERAGTRTTLRLTMRLRDPGVLHGILLTPPLGGPSKGMDADVEAAVRAKVAVTSRELQVH